jgi:6-pyruvoyltetrahydropterin/6-carboxytetrahydropterin synthase
MKIAKEYIWEMGHRLPFHDDGCKNLHGHSYKLRIELEGELNSSGIVVDYYDIDKIVQPILSKLDHSFLACKDDKELITALEKLNSKHVIINFPSTAENICKYILGEVCKFSFTNNVKKVSLRVYETTDTYAEESVAIN